jgi:AcrR family transcriptional regulator
MGRSDTIEVGYDRLTMDAVAARANAGKTTIYRRWAGKADLVVDALSSKQGLEEPPDTGSLRGDLRAFARMIDSADSRSDAKVIIGMVTAAAREDQLSQVFRERLLAPQLARIRPVFDRAVARGEIPRDRDLDLLALLFPSLALHHLLTVGALPDAGFAQRIMEDVVLPLATASPSDLPNADAGA